MFVLQYEKAFPKKEVKIRVKDLNSPWMTKGLLKSSKKKQRLYTKFLKNKTYENENKYKKYKNLFEKLKKQSKKHHYNELLRNSVGNSKKTWDIMKEIIGKRKIVSNKLPNFLQNDHNENGIYGQSNISEKFNSFRMVYFACK